MSAAVASARPDIEARLGQYDRYLRALQRQKDAAQAELHRIYDRYKGHRRTCRVADRPLQLPSECTCGKADVDRLSELLFLMVHATEKPEGTIDGKPAWQMHCILCNETALDQSGSGEGVCKHCRLRYDSVRWDLRCSEAVLTSLPFYHRLNSFELWAPDRKAQQEFVREVRSFLDFVERT